MGFVHNHVTRDMSVNLAGDPLQLGAVIQSPYAKSLGLTDSLLERLLNRFPYIRDHQGFPETGGYDSRLVTRLVYNYRSLPEILSLPSNLFYDGEVKPTVSKKNLHDYVDTHVFCSCLLKIAKKVSY